MLTQYAKKHTPLVAIAIFLLFFGIIQYLKPAFLFKPDGSLREFGIGYKKKTIFPLWLLSLILGIFAYLLVCYIANPIF